MMSMRPQRLILIIIFVLAITLFYVFDVGQYLTLEGIKAQQAAFADRYAAHPFMVALAFTLVYVAVTALSLPSAALLTLLAGALFGFGWGLLIVSLASTTGATLAFLAARYILRDTIQSQYADKLKGINDNFKKEGVFYLFALRLVPAVPFFLINLLMGLLPIRTLTYFVVSQIGMLPGTAVYVFAGTALASINSLKDIMSPQILIAFVLLGLLPMVLRFTLQYIKKVRAS